MTNYDFYIETKNTLEAMATLKNISTNELERYYAQTDKCCYFYKDLEGIDRVFAQMLFHAQNATMISNIVKFEKIMHFLKRLPVILIPQIFLTSITEVMQ